MALSASVVVGVPAAQADVADRVGHAAAKRIKTTVRVKLLDGEVVVGERSKLKVTVLPRAKRDVVLERQTADGWSPVDEGVTSRRGKETFKVKATYVDATYRVVAPKAKVGRKKYAADESPTRTVDVQAQTASLELPLSVEDGDVVNASARFFPARQGRDTVLQVVVGNHWETVDRDTQSATGRSSFRFTARGPVVDTYRVLAKKLHGALKVNSQPQTLQVTKTDPADTTPPPVPSDLTATRGDSSVDLVWNEVPGTDVVGYRVYSSTNNGNTWNAEAFSQPAQATITGLANYQQYRFAVTSVDDAGNESNRSVFTTATPVDLTPPAVPTGLAIGAGDGTITFGWDAVADEDLAGYRVYQREDGGPAVQVGGLTHDTSYTATGLTNYTEYTFTVTAVDSHGNESAQSAAALDTPRDLTPPDAPLDLTAVARDGEVRLDWTAVSADDLDFHRVYRREQGAADWDVQDAGRSNAFVDTEVVNDTTYEYGVTAVDTHGNESDMSNVVEVTPTAR